MKSDRLSTNYYPAYKDSGIEYLSKIPKKWGIKRIKDVGAIRYGLSQPPKYIEEGLPLIRATNIEKGKVVDKGLVFISPNDVPHDRDPVLVENDVVVVRSGAYTADSAIITKKYHGAIAGFDMVLRPSKIQAKYLSFALLSNYLLEDQLILSSFRAAQPHLNKEELGTALIVYPSFPEQEAIAHYLDTKTAQIDRKIDLLTQKATLYGNLKQSLINETVTRGLDKSVAMKDSSIDWLSEIPKNWEVKRIKDIGVVVLGKMLNSIGGDDKFYRYYLKSKNIGWLKVNTSNVEQMYFSLAEMKYCRLNRDDLLLSEGGEVGKTSIWGEEIDECYIQNSVQKITLNRKNHPRYFLYQSFLLGSIRYYDSIVNHVSIKHLTKEKLSKVVWVYPPPPEQKLIADYLDTKTAKIDQIAQTINTQIEKLQELRKTLVNDVVTGKIKVT